MDSVFQFFSFSVFQFHSGRDSPYGFSFLVFQFFSFLQNRAGASG